MLLYANKHLNLLTYLHTLTGLLFQVQAKRTFAVTGAVFRQDDPTLG